MRISTRMIYTQSAYRLNQLTSNLSEAREKVSTSRRINTASDDPLGTEQVMAINATLSALDQKKTNIVQGQGALTLAESSLDAMGKKILALKQRCLQLSNASANPTNRADAAQGIMTVVNSLMAFANTQYETGYVFGGNHNETAPFCYDNADNPTCVRYLGGTAPIRIQRGEDTVTRLQRCGSDLFYEKKIVVDETNNQIFFKEDPGTGDEAVRNLKTTIPSGTYSKKELARAVEKAMNRFSLKNGYGIGYTAAYDAGQNRFSLGRDGQGPSGVQTHIVAHQTETARISGLGIFGGQYPRSQIRILNPSAVKKFTPKPEGSLPLTLDYGDDGKWTVKNDPGYGLPAKIKGEGNLVNIDLDRDGVPDIRLDLKDTPKNGIRVSFDLVQANEDHGIMPDLGFGGKTVCVPSAVGRNAVAESITVISGKNDRVDFRETLDATGKRSAALSAVIPPGVYKSPKAYARAVEEAMENASARSGNRVNYEVNYRPETKLISIREDTGSGRQLKSLDLLFSSGAHSASSAAADLGFGASDESTGPVAGEKASWGVFDTLFAVRTALSGNDINALERAVTRLDTHYKSITSAKSSLGLVNQGLSDSKETAANDRLSLINQRKDIRDADSVEAIMNLKAAEKSYEAALGASSKIMKRSLLDYI